MSISNKNKAAAKAPSPVIYEDVAPTPTSTQEVVEDRASDTRANKTAVAMTRANMAKAKRDAIKAKMTRVLYSNVLELPQSSINRLKALGFTHRWVRYKASEFGRDDPSNVAKWLNLGYSFVKLSDAPELGLGYNDINHSVYGDIITVGDLVLMKIPNSEREALIELKEEETLRRSQGILSDSRRPFGVTSERRSFVTRAQGKAEEIEQEIIGRGEGEDGQEDYS